MWWYFTQFKCEATAFERILESADLAQVNTVRGNDPSIFVVVGLRFGNISLSRGTKCIESYGRSPGN